MILEGIMRLLDKRCAIRKEEDIRHPVLTLKHINERNDRPRLAGSRGHDQKPRTLLVAELLANLRDGGNLIVASRDVAVDLEVDALERFAVTLLDKPFQLINRVERPNLPRRIEPVDAPYLVAVGVVENRCVPVFLFKALAVQLNLLAAFLWPDGSLLRLNDGERFQVASVKHIVAEPLAGVVGHSLNLDFHTSLAGQHRPLGFKNIPTRLFKIDVDVCAACLRLADVTGSRLRRSSFELRINRLKERCAGFGGKLRMVALHLAVVFGVHAEDSHKLKIAQTLFVSNELANWRFGKKLQERRLGRHFCALALVNCANAVTNCSPTRNSRRRRVFFPGHFGDLPYDVFDCHVGPP